MFVQLSMGNEHGKEDTDSGGSCDSLISEKENRCSPNHERKKEREPKKEETEEREKEREREREWEREREKKRELTENQEDGDDIIAQWNHYQLELGFSFFLLVCYSELH